MRVDNKPIIAKIPVCIITKLRDIYKGNKNDLIECVLINYNQNDYASVALEIEGYKNQQSQFGYYYVKRKDLDKFMETGEYEEMENKDFKYYYRVEYLERDLVKIIGANTHYNLGEVIVITSESHKYCLGVITEVLSSKEEVEAKYKCKGIFNRRIVCKIEDEYGRKKSELTKTQNRIKEINKLITDKYLLLLLDGETTPELDELKKKLKEDLVLEKLLKEGLEKYE